MTTTLLPEVATSDVRIHPSNPRHSAKADPEMVASVKGSGLLQPLILAPTGEAATPYVLIDGHRRYDALKKAKVKVAPAIVYTELTDEGDQVQAMVLASLHRRDLTPLEEAEAFEQLRGLKWTQTKISESTGVPVGTIRERLKLLKLSKPTQNRIHKGQLSLKDALDLVSFDDDPDTQAKLVKAAGTWSWDFELANAKRARKARAHADQVEANLLEQGIPRYEIPDGQTWWSTRNVNTGPVEVEHTFSEDGADHPGCHAFARWEDHGGPTVKLICTDPAKHAKQLDKAVRERREADAAAQETRKQEAHDRDVAGDVRALAVLKVAEEVALPAPITDLLRALLPALLFQITPRVQQIYGELVDEPGLAARSEYYRVEWSAFVTHLEAINTMPPAGLTRCLTAVLVAHAEATIGYYQAQDHSPLVLRYYELLEQLDHHRSDVDEQVLTVHRGDDPDQAASA